MTVAWTPEPGLSNTECAMQEVAHTFALEVMRPTGIALDRLAPAGVIAAQSPLWPAIARYRELGLNLVDVTDGLSPVEAVRLTYLVNEELGWGDLGLGWSMYAATFPAALARQSGRRDLMEVFRFDQIGCWGITEPDHGSDMLDFTHTVSGPEHGGRRSNCVARRRGDTIVITGQKSAWCSNGSIADTMSLFCRYDDGSGAAQRAALLVPLDRPGIRRSAPIHKLGVRALSDSEIFFDDVEIPASYMVCPPEAYEQALAGILIAANPGMSIFIIGCARAAYEHAVAYAKERVQGGRPIFEYQAVRLRLFEMFRKIQAARALSRHVMLTHAMAPEPRLELAVSAKVTATQMALEVTNAAFEIFGGNAMTRDYPVEKLLRDARLGTIADGTNEVLSLMASSRL
jgi:acyl-CoA dehydrogenase